jgi:GTP-binding protein YchF
MSLSIGIVGFPNVGKSTLFNALLRRQAALAANYPFATIEPNTGIAEVPDARLAKLAEIVGTSVIKPATVEFVDIAGLVKGASKGEGLGNKFLANIRNTNAVCHVVRAFEDDSVLREGAVSPQEDLAAIRMELLLADLETLGKQAQPKGTNDKELLKRWQVVQELLAWVEDGKVLHGNWEQFTAASADDIKKIARDLCLLSAKPEIFVVNVSENQLQSGVDKLQEKYASELNVDTQQICIVSAKIESELASLDADDQAMYLEELGLEQSGLERLAAVAYKTLNLQSFLTAGEVEVRAWTITAGATAPQAAGVIHTDFEKKFIKANVTSYDDFVAFGGWKGVKEKGKLRLEGRDYIMQEGDIVEFMIGS